MSHKDPIIAYYYRATIHMALCLGPIDAIRKIYVDKKKFWDGEDDKNVEDNPRKLGNLNGRYAQYFIHKRDIDFFGGFPGAGGLDLVVIVQSGKDGQTVSPQVRAITGNDTPAYRGVATVLAKGYIGTSPNIRPFALETTRTTSIIPKGFEGNVSVTAFLAKSNIGLAMNPAIIIAECITSPVWGMGYSFEDLDLNSFNAAADTMATEKMGFSLLWDNPLTIEKLIQLVLSHIDASLIVDSSSGKFALKLVRDDYDVDDLLTLDESSISKITNFKRNTIKELVNSVTVNYTNSNNGKEASITVRDIALEREQGAVISETFKYNGFQDGELASRVASRELKALSTPSASCVLQVSTVASTLSIGDVFILSYDDYGLDDVVMRITNIQMGSLENNEVKINCVEDIFAYSPITFTQEQDAPPQGVHMPAPIQFISSIEAPYWEVIKIIGQQRAQELTVGAGLVMTTGVAPTSDTFTAQVWAGSGSEVAEPTRSVLVRPEEYHFAVTGELCPSAVLSGEIGYLDTELMIVDITDASGIIAGHYAVIDGEIIVIEQVQEGSITVRRGCMDTVPTIHFNEARIYFGEEYYNTDEVEYGNGVIFSTMLPTTPRGTLDIDDITSTVPVYIQGRADKPYPPAGFTVNGNPYPASIDITQAITVSWKHRDRTQESEELHGNAYDVDIGPETGTTYTVTLLQYDGTAGLTSSGITTIRNEEGLVGTSFTFPAGLITSNLRPIIIRLYSERNQSVSYQYHYVIIEHLAAGDTTSTGYGLNYGGVANE